jgi:hypothetical protein
LRLDPSEKIVVKLTSHRLYIVMASDTETAAYVFSASLKSTKKCFTEAPLANISSAVSQWERLKLNVRSVETIGASVLLTSSGTFPGSSTRKRAFFTFTPMKTYAAAPYLTACSRTITPARIKTSLIMRPFPVHSPRVGAIILQQITVCRLAIGA